MASCSPVNTDTESTTTTTTARAASPDTADVSVHSDEEAPPVPRLVTLERHSDVGFGFVAGSEKPVVVRFVKEGGPSEGLLLSEDRILEINGEDVSRAPRDRVIDLVKSCQGKLEMTVCQPHRITNRQTMRKSSLLTAAKKARLKANPNAPRVRFAQEPVVVAGNGNQASSFSSCIPYLSNVLKVFLENGQTKTFKYDSNTCVQDVLNSLVEKLSIRNPLYFSMCLEHMKAHRRNKLTLLDPKDSLSKVAARPGSHNFRCLFRVVFVPKDISELLESDPVSFEYFYSQSCNDIVQERFAPELKYEIALRLSALHLLQHAIATGMVTHTNSKVNVKAIEKEFTLKQFVPYTLVETMKSKELHKLLNHYLKQNQVQLCPASQKTLTALEAKVHYLRIISELPSYGAKIFPMNIRESILESAILVSRKLGLGHVTALRNSMPVTLAQIEDIVSIRITSHEDLCTVAVEIHLRDASGGLPFLSFALEEKDADELALTLSGYHRLIVSESRKSSNHDTIDIPYKELPVIRETLMQPNERTELGDFVRKMGGSSFTSPNGGEMNDMPVNCNGKWYNEGQSKDAHNVTHVYDANSIGNDFYCSQSEEELCPPSGTFRVVSTLDRHPLMAARRQRMVADAATSANEDSAGEDDEDDTGSRNSQCDSLQASEEIDLPSIVSMEILESAIVAEKRVKSEDVVQRVAEMKKIVADAQHYLNESSPQESSSNSDGSPGKQQAKQDASNVTAASCSSSSSSSAGKGASNEMSADVNKMQHRQSQANDDCESFKSESSSASLQATDSLLLIRHTPHGHLNNHHNGENSLGNTPGDLKAKCKASLVSHPTLVSLDAAGVSAVPTRHNGIVYEAANGHCDTPANERGIASLCQTAPLQTSNVLRRGQETNGPINCSSSSSRLDDPYEVTFTNSIMTEQLPLSDSSLANDTYNQNNVYSHTMVNRNLTDAENELIESLRQFGDEEVYYCNIPMNQDSYCTFNDQEIIDLTALPPPGEEDECDIAHGSRVNDVTHDDDIDDQPTYLNLASLRLSSHPALPTSSASQINNDNVSIIHQDEEESEYMNIIMPSSNNCSSLKRQHHGNQSTPVIGNSQRYTQDIHCHGSDIDKNLEELIASLSVPPPPLSSSSSSQVDNHVVYSTSTDCTGEDDLESLIVPPPPDDSYPRQQDDVIAKLWKLTDDVKKIYAPLPTQKCDSTCLNTTSTAVTCTNSTGTTHKLQQLSKSCNSATQVSPKQGGREVHSSSSGDSGYESILVLTNAPASTFANDCKSEFASGSTSSNYTTNSIQLDQKQQPQQQQYHHVQLAAERVNRSLAPTTAPCKVQCPLNANDAASKYTVNSENRTTQVHEKVDMLNGSHVTRSPQIISNNLLPQRFHCSNGKVAPIPPVRSKPPIPPTSPSIQERRKQLALAKAQVKARTGSIPVVTESHFETSNQTSANLYRSQDAIDDTVNSCNVLTSQQSNVTPGHFNHSTVTRQAADETGDVISPLNSACHANSYSSPIIRSRQPNVTDIFAQVQKNIRVLVSRVEDMHETRLRCDPCDVPACDESKLNQSKNLLIMESRVFVTASKLFVKLATEGSSQVLNHLVDCYSLLDRMFKIAEVVVINTESQAQVTCLIDRLKEVAANFTRTIETVVSLVRVSPDASPSMDCLPSQHRKTSDLTYLMNHATCLATSLSALMRTLTAFSSY